MKEMNLDYLQGVIFKAVRKAGFDVLRQDIHIERTKSLSHGHFATNIAMLLAGKAGKTPRDIAQKIQVEIQDELIEKAEIAGPGFINLFIEQNFYTKELSDVIQNLDEYLQNVLDFTQGHGTMVIDYSHPNIAKPMGVHHLLSTIIGDAIKKLYKRLGYKVIADNFIGDMGTQFGKLIHAIKKWGDMEEIEKDPINALQKLYVQYHIESDEDVEMDDAARAEFKKFEEGDKENRKLWKKIKKWSLMEIQPIYDRLNIEFDEMNGESFYEGKMQPILEKGRQKGVIVDGERGAWIIKPDDPQDPPTIVRRSDGATLYLTRDLARIQHWEASWHPDLMVNVVDIAQTLHFRQLFEAARKLELTSAKNVHVAFGRMQFKSGAMSTRKGNILLLSDLLDEAEKRAKGLVDEKASDLSADEKRKLARILGIGSVKYNILHQNRSSNITFDWETMLSFDGNSAPYLLYTVTRAESVLNKSGDSEFHKKSLQLNSESEQKLAIQLLMYPDALERAEKEFKPNHIANYLYDLAQLYNTFYNSCPILQADSDKTRESRLMLTAATVTIMTDALLILGIEVPHKM